MFHAIEHCHNTSLWNSTSMVLPFLSFIDPSLCSDYIFMDAEYNDRLCFLNQVDSNIDLLDNVILQQVVIQRTKKPRSVGAHKSKLTITRYKKEIIHQRQEIQECKYTTT